MRLRTNDLYLTEVDGRTVILDGRTSDYLTTNEVGTFILAELGSDVSEQDLITRVSEAYGVEESVVEADCRAFLASLHDHEMIDV